MSALSPPASRNLQLDGWRALSVLGVMWLHWTPESWHRSFPYEAGVFFLFALTGFLITRILLRERTVGAQQGPGWRQRAFLHFQRRRALRILTPCLAAMALSWLLGAPDLWAHPLVYLGQISNFHLAMTPENPEGSVHYWTLAVQQQIYLLWPLVLLWCPRRLMAPALVVLAMLGDVSTFITYRYFPQVVRPGMLTPCTLNFFAIGGLLAYAMDRGLKPGDRRVTWAGWIALVLYALQYAGHPPVHLPFNFQQTYLAIASAALISSTLAGIRGWVGNFLVHPVVQQLGRMSYSMYLFHSSAALLAGKLFFFLWWMEPCGWVICLRLAVQAVFAWGLAWLAWHYIEQPLDRLKSRLPAATANPKAP